MKKLFLILVSASFYSATAMASPCPKPTGNVARLFEMIADRQISAQNVESFFRSHVIAIDALDEECRTPFWVAVALADQSKVEMLYGLSGNPDLNTPFEGDVLTKKRTTFEFALNHGSLTVIDWLRSKGGVWDSNRWNEMPELMIAVGNRIEVVKALIAKGADVNAKELSSQTSILCHAAERAIDAKVIEVLIKAGARVNDSNTFGVTPFLFASAYNRSIDVMKTLVSAGAHIHAESIDQVDALMLAAQFNSAEMVQYLIQLGLPVNKKSKNGFTAIFSAVTNSDEAVKILIQAGADVNARTNLGNSPLMQAASRSWSDGAVRLLIQAGAEVNATNAVGTTALMMAAAQSRYAESVAQIKTLLSAGANKDARNKENKTAYDYAVMYEGLPEALQLLKP